MNPHLEQTCSQYNNCNAFVIRSSSSNTSFDNLEQKSPINTTAPGGRKHEFRINFLLSSIFCLVFTTLWSSCFFLEKKKNLDFIITFFFFLYDSPQKLSTNLISHLSFFFSSSSYLSAKYKTPLVFP